MHDTIIVYLRHKIIKPTTVSFMSVDHMLLVLPVQIIEFFIRIYDSGTHRVPLTLTAISIYSISSPPARTGH